MYTSAIDVDRVTAIDVHVHVEVDDHGRVSLADEFMDASAAYFEAGERTRRSTRSRSTIASVGWPPSSHGRRRERHGPPTRISKEEVAEVRPGTRRAAALRRRRPRQGQGGRPRAAPPGHRDGHARRRVPPQPAGLLPNDRSAHPLYEELAALGVPALFHTGQTGIRAGLPGGGGVKLCYSGPMLIDDVAADLPELTVILAHPSFPWQDSALSVATHKANAYIDLSGWSPKYFPLERPPTAEEPA